MKAALELPVIPLRLLVVADLSPSAFRPQFVNVSRIDKESFNEVLRRLSPRVEFHLHDESTNAYTKIEFPVDDLRSFHPSSLGREVETLRDSLQGRQALTDLRDSKISREQFLEQLKALQLPLLSRGFLAKVLETVEGAPALQPASPPPPVPTIPATGEESVLDSILSMVKTPGEVRPAGAAVTEGAARVRQFISHISPATATKGASDRRALEGLISECDRELSKHVNAIMNHPEFVRLESSWRSLKFLVDRTDFREPIRIEVISAEKKQLIQIMQFLLEHSTAAESPVAAVITDFEFTNSAPDVQLLKEAAEIAAQMQSALLVNTGPAFFGKGGASDVSAIPLLRSHLESAEFLKWASFRQSEASRWVGVCFNRFLLRNPFDEASPKLPFRFTEQGNGLWGNPVFAIGSMLARSFAQTGWCGHITGLRGGGLIEDLPVGSHRLASGGETQIPLEAFFLKDRGDDFFADGFMVLQSGENRDTAVLLRAPSAHSPGKFSEVQATEISRWRSTLMHQLVAARFIQYLDLLLQRLLPCASPEEIERGVERGLGSLISGGSVRVRLASSEDRPGLQELQIQIQPGPEIWSLPIGLEFRMGLNLGS